MYFDWTYLLVLAGMVLSLLASAMVKRTYAKYEKVRSMSGLTGAQAAEKILRSNGIYDVSIEHVEGNLTDHYDPGNKVLRLSDSVYNNSSVAAIGVIHLFSLSVLFQIVTLPVEFNASRRAIRVLSDMGILYGDEVKDTKKVLFAAALTYVAAAAGSILQLVRLIMIGRRND